MSDFDGRDVRIEASELGERLEEWEMQLVSWPVLNGTAKGDRPPPGRLGRGYLVTYVHRAQDDEVVVRERVYPFARPNPVAFTMKGQTQKWSEDDWTTRRVEPGWRPMQEGIAAALFTRGDADSSGRAVDPWTWLLPLAGVVAAVAGVLLSSKRRRSHGEPRAPSPI